MQDEDELLDELEEIIDEQGVELEAALSPVPAPATVKAQQPAKAVKSIISAELGEKLVHSSSTASGTSTSTFKR